MRYILAGLLLLLGFDFSAAQTERKITIKPFRPQKEQRKTPRTSITRKKPAQTGNAIKEQLSDKQQITQTDTVNSYLRKESTRMLEPEKDTRYAATVPGFVAGERSRYQKGQTSSTRTEIPFSHPSYDKFDQDPRLNPVDPKGLGPSSGGVGGLDFNHAFAMLFSKKERLKARNAKNRLWEKYPKVTPDDSLVNKLNVQPSRMLSKRQQADSVRIKKQVTAKDSLHSAVPGETRQANSRRRTYVRSSND